MRINLTTCAAAATLTAAASWTLVGVTYLVDWLAKVT